MATICRTYNLRSVYTMKENDIRPHHIFKKYLELCRKDAEDFFSQAETIACTCPACGNHGSYAFVKDNFSYSDCPNCHTLFANPRPLDTYFSNYYKDAPSTRFWAEEFYKETESARREKIWKPKAKLVFDILEKYGYRNSSIVDIGGGYGIFSEEISKLTSAKVLVIEPSNSLAAVCKEKGLTVHNCFLADIAPEMLPEGKICFVSFELFEHLQDPNEFTRQVVELMKPGDLFIFTTLSGTGADIQALWEDSKSVSPPHHLNFFNPQSVQILLDNCGLETLSVTTPGKLDVDIMLNNLDCVKDRFWRTFLQSATPEQRDSMQQWLADNNFSSHMLVVSRRK